MKRDKIIYWVSTILLCGVFAFSAFIHLLKTEMVQGFYQSLGFPAWIALPNGILKVCGIVAILSEKSKFLKEWAYAGFFFDGCLALAAHLIAKDGGHLFSVIAIISLVVSRFYWGRLFKK